MWDSIGFYISWLCLYIHEKNVLLYLEKCREKLLNYEVRRIDERLRSLLDVGAPCEAERNIGGDYFLHAHRRTRPVWQRASSSKRSVEGHNRGISTLLSVARVQRWCCSRDRSFLSFFFFFLIEKVSIRLVVPCKIVMEIVLRNKFLAFCCMRIADCDSVRNGRPTVIGAV